MSRLTTAALVAASMMVSAATHAADIPAAVTQAAGSIHPAKPDSIHKGPVDGFYELVYGAQVFYVSADGRYVLAGNIIDLETRENLTETRKNGARIKAIHDLGPDSMITFAPQDPKYHVYVFTDTNCGYCRKLHQEMAQIEAEGIAVSYLAFPAISADSFPEMVSVWCADDPQAAMTAAKAGEVLAKKECDNPIQNHFRAGREMGVRGTPAIVLENGELLPGYVPAKELAKRVAAAR